MRSAVWNVRGVGSTCKKRMVKTLLKEESIKIIGLIETKHSNISAKDMEQYWGNQDCEWLHIPAEEGGSGGIILTWIKESFSLIKHIVRQRWIAVKGILQQEWFPCTICVVYAPNDQHERLDVWNQLRAIKKNLAVPLLLMGDFNEVLSPEERRGASDITSGMRDLRQCVQDLQLIDLAINLKYALVRRKAVSRIDRVLVEAQFLESFPMLSTYL